MRTIAEEQETDYMQIYGSTGLTRFGGWVNEEWLTELRGINGVKRYKEMRDNDAVIGAILFAIKMLIMQATWSISAASDSQQDQDAAQFARECLFEDMEQSWKDILNEITSMFPFGWAYHEMVFKRRLGPSEDKKKNSKFSDGRIGFRKIPLRAQETFFKWEFDDEGDVLGLWQIAPPDYALRFIPIEKSLLFKTENYKSNPEGRSILRNANRSYYFKKNIEEIEGIGIERDLAGLPIARVPQSILRPDASKAEKAAFESIKRLVTQVRRDEAEGIVFPASETPEGKKTGYDFSLLSTGSRRQFDTNQIITRYDQRIAMSVLADFILIGHETVGSFALSSSKTEIFGMAVGAFLDIIAEIFNTKAIPTLFKLNSFPGIISLPILEHSEIKTPDLPGLAQYITALSGAGMPLFPDDELENYFRRTGGFPEKNGASVTKRDTSDDIKQLRDDIRKALEDDEED